MTSSPRVSLVIVSRNRKYELAGMLRALRYQSFDNFEIIVVSDHMPITPADCKLRHILFKEANIAKARNLGIGAAAGDIIAFCDDDAVPEPHWLTRLVAAFEAPEVGLAGGYVRARNGISYQWKSCDADFNGDDHLIDIQGQELVSIRQPTNDRYPRVQGTNCAFRREALTEIGGFDPAFAFYLDETELCLRLGAQNWACAIVPDAEVQHGFAANETRHQNRAPKSLYQIGVSKGYFIKKHGSVDAIEAFVSGQKRRLINYMVAGYLEPGQIKKLMRELADGLEAGRILAVKPQKPIMELETKQFQKAFQSSGMPLDVFAGKWRNKHQLIEAAKKAPSGGMVFSFSNTTLFHRRYFDARGFWVQQGGLFGKSHRDDRLFKYYSFEQRLKRELELLASQRDFNKVHYLS